MIIKENIFLKKAIKKAKVILPIADVIYGAIYLFALMNFTVNYNHSGVCTHIK